MPRWGAIAFATILLACGICDVAQAQPAPPPPAPAPAPAPPAPPAPAPPLPEVASQPAPPTVMPPPMPAPPPAAPPPFYPQQPPAGFPPSGMAAEPPRQPPADGPKSPAVAGLLSGLLTGVPIGIGFALIASMERNTSDDGRLPGGLVLVSLGAVFGPAAGHYYAGDDYGRTTGLMFARLGAFGLAVALPIAGLASNDPAPFAVLTAFGAVSGCLGLGLMVWDLVDAPSAATRSGRERGGQASLPELRIGPTGGAATWRF